MFPLSAAFRPARPPAGQLLLRHPRQLSSRGGGRPRSPGAECTLKGSDSSCGGVGRTVCVGWARPRRGHYQDSERATGREPGLLPAAGSCARRRRSRGRSSVQLRGGAGRGGPPPVRRRKAGGVGHRAVPGEGGHSLLGLLLPARYVPTSAHAWLLSRGTRDPPHPLGRGSMRSPLARRLAVRPRLGEDRTEGNLSFADTRFGNALELGK